MFESAKIRISAGLRDPIVVLATIFLILCVTLPNAFVNPNTISRLGLSQAILRNGSLSIDEVAPYTIDRAARDGHYYCDKAPGISFLCLPGVALANGVADAVGLPPELIASAGPPSARLLLASYGCLLSISIITALGLLSFGKALQTMGVANRSAALVTVFLGFGTPYLIWSTAIFGHAAAAALLFMAFSRSPAIVGPNGSDSARLGVAGLCLGLAVLVEFTALPPAALIAVFLTLARPQPGYGPFRRGIALSLGALPPLLLLLIYNHEAFGGPFRFGYGAVQGFAGMKTGLFGISAPNMRVAWEILIGPYRGIAWLSPILSISVAACGILIFRRNTRLLGLLIAAITVYYVLLNSGYYYWDGGFSTGPRHITPIVPFLMFALGMLWDRMPTRLRQASVILGAAGIAIILFCTLVSITAPNNGKPMLGEVLASARELGAGAIAARAAIPSFTLLMLGALSQFLKSRQSIEPSSRLEGQSR